jgi:branched-chain amino acid transport system ATP-binding protein
MRHLELEGVSKSFGGIAAVREISLGLERGEIRAVIGPNGAGKTTLVSLISGRVHADSGRARFEGEDITWMPAWQRVMRGIVYVFQITSIFPRLTCYENVALAAQRRLMQGWRNLLALPEGGVARTVDQALNAVGLAAARHRRAGELAYGHQRLLELAMGLTLKPSLLILDEPTQGLAAGEIESLCALIRRAAQSMTILLIEHNIQVVLELATKITVMDRGSILAEGSPETIERHPAVQQAYLGG